MSLIAQKIKNLLNGVSQQPPELRSSSQAAVQENALSSPARGLRKRPPTQQIAKLAPFDPSYLQSNIHLLNRSTTEQYVLVILEGDLKVFDVATGVELPVTFPQGKDYLWGTDFRVVTVGDYTFLVNRRKTVELTATAQPTRAPEAFVVVRQADYSTNYEITLDSSTVSIKTVDNTAATSKGSIGSDSIANDLAVALLANSTINTNFSVSRLGSTIYLKRKNNADFTVKTNDGLSGQGLLVAKGKVQTIADLPPKAVAGAMLEVEGEPGTPLDNFWVVFEPNGGADWFNGVWRECPAPGTLTTLDAATMPWSLVRSGGETVAATASSQPAAPVVAYEGTWQTAGFTKKNALTVDPAALQTLTANGDILETLTLGPDGDVAEVSYSVNALALSPGATLTVDALVDPGDGQYVAATKTYAPGARYDGETLWVDPTFNGKLWLRATYTGSPAVLATVSVPGNAIRHITPTGTTITFDPFAVYPAGTTVSLGGMFASNLADPRTWTYATDAYGADVAADLRSHLLADSSGNFTPSTATMPSASVVRVVDLDGSCLRPLPTVTASFDTAKTVFDPTLALVPAAHVGATLKNLTTGATGTITSNSARALTASGGLTGGTRSTILPGDRCTVLGTGASFVFQQVTWKTRGAGSTTTCPFPSFVGRTLSEVFFYQNRLGFTAGENIILSAAGDLFNFWRQTASQLLADDLIDIKSAHADVALFDHAFLWRDGLYLGSGAGHQFLLSGDPVLTPTTVRLDHITSYPMSARCRPLVMGNRVFLPRSLAGATRVMEYLVRPQEEKPVAEEITLHVPTYLPGSPRAICGDAAQEFFAVLTDGATDSLWVYSDHYEGGQRQQASWSRWVFPGATVVWADMAEGTLLLLVIRADGVYLEKIALGTLPAAGDDHRDRQGSGSEVPYTFRYTFSPIYFRDQRSDEPETAGRLTLRYLALSYHDTRDFTVTVTSQGRTAVPYTFSSDEPAAGIFRIPVFATNTTATIELTSSAPTGCAFSGLDWEANYTARAQRR